MTDNMGDTAVSFENVSKQYYIGEVGTGSLARDLNRWWALMRGREDPTIRLGDKNRIREKGASRYAWALRDVSFKVQYGEVLGIIGSNGAGKSTMLKILSRITSPTQGRILVNGKLASLLEVGTGFHLDLSGRENIYLNGAIMGMTKSEINRKFDAIVQFAGCARYVDTPVKRYSTGMQVRLGFAVAAHLEPDILVVDEVLAVGDAEFQRRCLGKMKEVSEGGRTVIFVSHDLKAVRSLCDRCIVVAEGGVRYIGSTDDAIAFYTQSGNSSAFDDGFIYQKAVEPTGVQITGIKLLDENHKSIERIYTGQKVTFRVFYSSDIDLEQAGLEIQIKHHSATVLLRSTTKPDLDIDFSLIKGSHAVDCTFTYFPLAAGRYQLCFSLCEPEISYLSTDDVLTSFEVIENDVFDSGTPPSSDRMLFVTEVIWDTNVKR